MSDQWYFNYLIVASWELNTSSLSIVRKLVFAHVVRDDFAE